MANHLVAGFHQLSTHGKIEGVKIMAKQGVGSQKLYIDCVKAKIQEKEGIPVDEQELILIDDSAISVKFEMDSSNRVGTRGEVES